MRKKHHMKEKSEHVVGDDCDIVVSDTDDVRHWERLPPTVFCYARCPPCGIPRSLACGHVWSKGNYEVSHF